jgi:hypothetical protein
MIRRLRAAAEGDPRIAGLLDYGSGGFGRADEWSDVDVAVFVRDEDFDAFTRDWKAWAGRFGTLLLAYTGRYGHPWAVYDAEPGPLRVDFDLHRASATEAVRGWPNSPLSVESMVWYDVTGGRLTTAVAALVGKSLRPPDLRAAFDAECGDFWYFLLYTHAKLRRGQHWVARQVFHGEVMDHLFKLLRLEAGAIDYWDEFPNALGAERILSAERLARLDACVPPPGPAGLWQAMATAARLGREVCANVAACHGWPWPDTLATRTVALLEESGTQMDADDRG